MKSFQVISNVSNRQRAKNSKIKDIGKSFSFFFGGVLARVSKRSSCYVSLLPFQTWQSSVLTQINIPSWICLLKKKKIKGLDLIKTGKSIFI
jgi:hypothetical protein